MVRRSFRHEPSLIEALLIPSFCWHKGWRQVERMKLNRAMAMRYRMQEIAEKAYVLWND
ncbi:hypothetical protein SFK272_2258 [Shigella flexneri K-272]|nr:hypothetical protein SFK272_2258 [Shigella flexneri K-272]